jgi:hypothetical protein
VEETIPASPRRSPRPSGLTEQSSEPRAEARGDVLSAEPPHARLASPAASVPDTSARPHVIEAITERVPPPSAARGEEVPAEPVHWFRPPAPVPARRPIERPPAAPPVPLPTSVDPLETRGPQREMTPVGIEPKSAHAARQATSAEMEETRFRAAQSTSGYVVAPREVRPFVANAPVPKLPGGPPGTSQSPPVPRASAPTIHVTIGRVEVRASPAALPERRAAKASGLVMSLDDYLRGRAKGGGS